jgi:hypothetical protein
MNYKGFILLITILMASWIYKTYFANIISDIISLESQCMIMMFISIITQLDNFALYYDLNNKNSLVYNSNYYIKIIDNQAVQLERNKIIIYNLKKINEININNEMVLHRRLKPSNSF